MVAIGILSRRSGCSAPTIRYYEQIGLIPKAARREGGHRTYDAQAVQRLILIRRYRELGFSVEQVRVLQNLQQDAGADCNQLLAVAQQHLQSVRAKLADLRALERTLVKLADSCAVRCAGGPVSDCTIVGCGDS